MTSIAIIDTIGLTYDGNTLQSRGLGGSESAVILMSKELAALGFDVTVFNNCIDKLSTEGTFDRVNYIDLTKLDQHDNYQFDIVISSRTVIPFLPEIYWNQFAELHPYRFKKIKQNSKLKIVWMHDTFCRGDHLLEDLLVQGDINEIFTLSDFHTTYVTNCDHGKRRMFEALKKHVFMTRNGIVKYHDEVDISAKDPNLYVYNASVTKGMLPLVNDIWPMVKQQLPAARLKVIGGYYRFRENAAPDEQEKTWRSMVDDPKYANMGIEFTGVIPQSQIADILTSASYTIFPGAFPETFGISSLESLAYNTPLITTRFGALEETAVEQACYFIEYPIEPNSLFTNIDKNGQIKKFVDLTVRAGIDRYLHQQKQYYCNIIKDICTWDTVALQWKQHFYKRLGLYLSAEEYRQVSYINSRIHEVFGRRFSNPEETYLPRKSEQRIVVISPMYNAASYIGKCIESVITQDYKNYHMYVIDDASTDNSVEVAAKNKNEHVTIISNKTNLGAVYNQISVIRDFCNPDDIVMLLDGDDSLVNNNQLFHYYNNLYDGTTEFTYGSCWSMIDNIPLVAQHYPNHIKQTRAYRTHKFNWNMPYTHLRTFLAKLIQSAEDSNFQDDHGNWFKAGGDGSVFYTAIEAADPSKVKAVSDIVYNYNDINPLNDYKVNGAEQTRTANKILGKKSVNPKFSVVVPTMWRCLEVFQQSLIKLCDHPLVGEIILINNDVAATPSWDVLTNDKIRRIDQESNIYVNPAWNLGVRESHHEKICIANDDILFDTAIFDRIEPRLIPDNGVFGLITGESKFGHPPTTDGSIDFLEWTPGNIIHGFGQLMFVHKDNWVDINPELKVFFGDDTIFHNHLLKGLKNYCIYNIHFESPMAQTTSDPAITKGMYDRELPIFSEWFLKNPVINNTETTTVVAEVKETVPVKISEKVILIAVPTNKYMKSRFIISL